VKLDLQNKILIQRYDANRDLEQEPFIVQETQVMCCASTVQPNWRAFYALPGTFPKAVAQGFSDQTNSITKTEVIFKCFTETGNAARNN
jgi:hypothetical protein